MFKSFLFWWNLQIKTVLDIFYFLLSCNFNPDAKNQVLFIYIWFLFCYFWDIIICDIIGISEYAETL